MKRVKEKKHKGGGNDGEGEQRAEKREGGRDGRGRTRGKVGESKESKMYRERQNKFNWRPRFKQRGLFSDRDPSQEIELENRLIEAVQDIAQHVPEHHVNKSRCALDCAELRRGCLMYMMQPVYENTDRPSGRGWSVCRNLSDLSCLALWRRGVFVFYLLPFL